MMDKIALSKGIVSFVTGFSVTYVVNQVISHNTAPEDVVDKTKVVVGSVVLGSLVAQAAKKHTDEQIDNIVAWARQYRHQTTK